FAVCAILARAGVPCRTRSASRYPASMYPRPKPLGSHLDRSGAMLRVQACHSFGRRSGSYPTLGRQISPAGDGQSTKTKGMWWYEGTGVAEAYIVDMGATHPPRTSATPIIHRTSLIKASSKLPVS